MNSFTGIFKHFLTAFVEHLFRRLVLIGCLFLIFQSTSECVEKTVLDFGFTEVSRVQLATLLKKNSFAGAF